MAESGVLRHQAKQLAALFRKNFEQFGDTPTPIRDAGPQIA